MVMELTKEEEQFCALYVGECNGDAIEAAIKAGLASDCNSARAAADDILATVAGKRRIIELNEERAREMSDKPNLIELKKLCVYELLKIIFNAYHKDRIKAIKTLAEIEGFVHK